MKSFFRKIALVLAFAMVFTAMPMGVFAEDNSFQYPSGYFVEWGFEYGNGVENANSSKEVKALIWLNGVQVTDFSDYEFEIGDIVYQNNPTTIAALSTTPQKGVFTFSAGTGYTDTTAYYPGVEIFVTVKHNGTVIDRNDPDNMVLPINVNIGPQSEDNNQGGAQGGNLEWIPGNNGFEIKDTETTTFYIDTTNVTSFTNASVKAFYMADMGPNGPIFNDLSGCYELVNDNGRYGIRLDGAKIAKALPREFSMFVIQAELRDAAGVAVAANTADINLVRTPSIFQTACDNGFIFANGTSIMERQWLGEVDGEFFAIVAENGTNEAVHQKYLESLYEAIFYGEDTTSEYFKAIRDAFNNWDGDDDYLNSQYDGGALEVQMADGGDNTSDEFKNHTLEELGKNTIVVLSAGMYMKAGILDRAPSLENPDELVDLTTFDYSEKYTHCEELTFYAYIPNNAVEDCGGIENVTLYCYDGSTDYAAVDTTVASDVGNNVLKFTTTSPMEYYFVCWNEEATGGEGESGSSSQPELEIAPESSTNEKLDEKLNKNIEATIDELVRGGYIDTDEVDVEEIKDAYEADPDSVRVELTYDFTNFDDMEESDFTTEQLEQIEKIVETANGQVVYGMDIVVERQLVVNGQEVGDPQIMTELPSDIEFSINLPEGVVDVPQGKKVKWVIFRNHNGEINKLPVKDNGNGTGTFKTDRFSYYVLGYEFVDADTTHNHVWGYNTQYDAAAHWDYCHVCGEKGAVVAHSYKDGACSCGWSVKSTNRTNPATGVTAEMLGE